MDTIDEFASTLLEEAKRFLERAKEARGEMAEVPNLHAALLLSLCSLEAYVNASADHFQHDQICPFMNVEFCLNAMLSW